MMLEFLNDAQKLRIMADAMLSSGLPPCSQVESDLRQIADRLESLARTAYALHKPSVN